MSPAQRGRRCRVSGCTKPGRFEIVLPGRISLASADSATTTFDVGICREHAEKLGDVHEFVEAIDSDVIIGWVDVEVEKAAGWRLVIEFVSSPDADPIVLYEPEAACQCYVETAFDCPVHGLDGAPGTSLS